MKMEIDLNQLNQLGTENEYLERKMTDSYENLRYVPVSNSEGIVETNYINPTQTERMNRKLTSLANFYKERKLWTTEDVEFQIKNIKFPNFYDESLDIDLAKSNISLEMFDEEVKNILELLEIIEKEYEILLYKSGKRISGTIQEKFRKNLINIMGFKIVPNLLSRQIILTKCLMMRKLKKDDEEFLAVNEKTMQNFFYSYFENPDKYLNEIVENNFEYFKENAKKDDEYDIIERTNTKSGISRFLCYEKSIFEFHRNNPDHFPSLTNLVIFLKCAKLISQNLINCFSMLKVKITSEQMALFYQNMGRLENFSEIFHICYKTPDTDIFNLPENSSEWMDLKMVMERRIYFPREKLQKRYDALFLTIATTKASIARGWGVNNRSRFGKKSTGVTTCGNIISTGFNMGFLSFRKNVSRQENANLAMNPHGIVEENCWNILDHKLLKHVVKIGLPRIKWSKKIYLKKTMHEINAEFLNKLIISLDNDLFNTISPKNRIQTNLLDTNTITTTENPHHYNCNTANDLYTRKISNKSELDKNYVKVRLISPGKHKIEHLSHHHSFWGFFNVFAPSQILKYPNSLIIHIHGGGFISMSSSTHEIFTRGWSKNMSVPIISIDYRLSPEYQYPAALDDVFQTYMWIIKHAETEFGLGCKKIVIVGDSAGGTLALSLTYLLIELGKRLPDALILAYPATLLSTNTMTPSFLNALWDEMLPLQSLRHSIMSYRGRYDKECDPFLSPFHMNDKVISMLPPIRIINGSMDPLRDQSIQFVHKLVKLKKDVKLIELKYFPHGFLNLNSKKMMPESYVAQKIFMDEIEPFLIVDNRKFTKT